MNLSKVEYGVASVHLGLLLINDSTYKKKRISIAIAIILFAAIFSTLPFSNVTSDLSNPSVLTDHITIFIDENTDFTKWYYYISGNGTSNNPYLLDNWSIDATSDHGIFIENTDAYFMIRNCYIFNGTNQSNENNGFHLKNVKNGVIENNRIEANNIGIYIEECNNITLHNNTILNNTYNFQITSSSSSYYYSEYDHTISTNNTVNGRPIYYLIGQSNKIIPSNAGFVGLVNCNNITVENLTLDHNGHGIILVSTTNSTIKNNTCHSNNYNGIYLISSSNNIIDNNT